MGGCSSCLGRGARDGYDESEESRLLYDDGGGMQYGGFGDGALGGDDSLEAQREAEALQRVVARTSSNIVDVFEIAPQDAPARGGVGASSAAPFAYAGQGARVARYQHLVARLGGGGAAEGDEARDAAAKGVRVDWLGEDDDGSGAADGAGVRLEGGGGPLVGTFADAAAAMQ